MATKSKKYPHAFFERNSWHYRTKVLQEDYSVKYGKVGGFQTAEEAEQAYRAHMEEFERAKEMRMLSQDKEITFADTTEVEFYDLTSEELCFYVDKYQPYDKAGAYAIQEWIGVVGIKSISGDFYNVMGLPVSKVVQAINSLNS